jgi:hypothetical protein
MTKTIHIFNMPVQLRLSTAAQRALEARTEPLYAEMELYFSCLIRLKVRFYDQAKHGNGVPAGDKLVVSFRPVMTRACGNDYEGDEPPLTDFPIAKKEAFVPKWLRIDYQHGQWVGEFGLAARLNG